MIIGIAGGMLGAFFIAFNTKMGALRKIILPQKWMKPVETVFWCVLTSSVFFFCSYLTYKNKEWCVDLKSDLDDE